MLQFFQNFFLRDISEDLEALHLFSWEHISLIVFTIVAAFALYHYREQLRKIKCQRKIRIGMAIILFTNMAIFYLNIIFAGEYDWHVHLPLHLCFITGYTFMYILVSDNQKLYRIVYFFTFIGPLPAMIWPNTVTRFDRFYTYSFFISHHIMLLMSLYCLFVLEYKVAYRDALRAFGWGNVLFAGIFVFNTICGTDYIMTKNLPAYIVESFPILRLVDSPIFWLEVCGSLGIGFATLVLRSVNSPRALQQAATRQQMACSKQ